MGFLTGASSVNKDKDVYLCCGSGIINEKDSSFFRRGKKWSLVGNTNRACMHIYAYQWRQHAQISACLHQNIFLVNDAHHWLWPVCLAAAPRQWSIKPSAAQPVCGAEWSLQNTEQRAEQEGVRLETPPSVQRRPGLQIYFRSQHLLKVRTQKHFICRIFFTHHTYMSLIVIIVCYFSISPRAQESIRYWEQFRHAQNPKMTEEEMQCQRRRNLRLMAYCVVAMMLSLGVHMVLYK